jgi:hypothetical protein
VKREELLVLTTILAFIFFAAIPFTGAFISRFFWRQFRRRYYRLLDAPILDYFTLNRCTNAPEQDFRFVGSLDSITEDKTIWVRSPALTLPIDLEGAYIYFIPGQQKSNEEKPAPEVPTRLKRRQIGEIESGCRVFVGGKIGETQDSQQGFITLKKCPLIVIFFEGTEANLTRQVSGAGRHRNEYWNTATPYAITAGIFSCVFIALSYLGRPAFRINVLAAFAAIFSPLLPLIPPGLVLTMLYRKCWSLSRMCISKRDLSLLAAAKRGAYIFTSLADQYARRAYFFEVIAWLFLIAAIAVNIFFIAIIILRLL